jgi:peptidase E
MMPAGPRLIAIGGGGATNGSDPGLEDFLLQHVQSTDCTIGYWGAASDDDPAKFDRLAARLARSGARASHLPMTSDVRATAAWVAEVDAIYCGGGNTKRLVEHMRESGCGTIFMDAARNGTLLAGVSAGALCWFDWALSDWSGNGLQPLRGLGLFAGSVCPHYSTEPERRRVFPDLIARSLLAGGIAIDDGVAVLFRPDAEPVAFSARDDCWAYCVSPDGAGGATANRLPAACALAAR